MTKRSACLGVAALMTLCLASPGSAEQPGGQTPPGGAVPKPAAPSAAGAKAAAATPAESTTKVAGNFGQWALVCGEPSAKDSKPDCTLVQALVEKETQKLVFRVSVGYGPKGNLVLRIDGPTGVALQKGLEFSPDEVKTYRLPFQTCVPQGCTAMLMVENDLKQDLQKAAKGTITVYALNGQAVKAPTELAGFGDGLSALDKRRAKP
jgi:invasion protein IalB